MFNFCYERLRAHSALAELGSFAHAGLHVAERLIGRATCRDDTCSAITPYPIDSPVRAEPRGPCRPSAYESVSSEARLRISRGRITSNKLAARLGSMRQPACRVLPSLGDQAYCCMNAAWKALMRAMTVSMSLSGGRNVVRKCHVSFFCPKPEPGTTTIPVASSNASA